jgi:hypothetical protein
MNLKEYYLVCLNEEVNEILESLSLLDESNSEKQKELIIEEVHDLIGVSNILKEFGITINYTYVLEDDFDIFNTLFRLSYTISKSLRFGLENRHPNEKDINLEVINICLSKIYSFLSNITTIDENKILKKENKVKSFLLESYEANIIRD